MGNTRKKAGGGSRLARSETVTVRLDPKLRYLAELAARKQRRTLSSFVEWAIEDVLSRVIVGEGSTFSSGPSTSLSDAAFALWDVDEADRFARLAMNYADLMTHDEQVLWKLVCENGYLWRGRYDTASGRWCWQLRWQTLIFEHLRKHWDDFVAVAKGEATKDTLPTWIDRKPSHKGDNENSTQDDIPF